MMEGATLSRIPAVSKFELSDLPPLIVSDVMCYRYHSPVFSYFDNSLETFELGNV